MHIIWVQNVLIFVKSKVRVKWARNSEKQKASNFLEGPLFTKRRRDSNRDPLRADQILFD